MSDYFEPEDKINKNIPRDLAMEVVALQDQLSAKMREVRKHRLENLTTMPKCSECRAQVYRPRCMYELGSSCPRHKIVAAYGGMYALGIKFGLVKKQGSALPGR